MPQNSHTNTTPKDAKPLGLSLSNARMEFDGHLVFKELSLDLRAGEITCLLGPSGVGKSSLLRLIAGLTEHSTVSGVMTLDGGLNLEGRIAYMDQRDLLLPWLSVADNVQLGSSLRGTEKIPAKTASVLDSVGLSSWLTHRPAALSGGMRQRVALARTLMEDRPIVLMDEPFSSLDVLNRLKLQDLAAKMLANKTVLLVTHDPLEAVRLGHAIYVLDGSPAVLNPVIRPTGNPPRPATDGEVHKQVTVLLHSLGVDGETH